MHEPKNGNEGEILIEIIIALLCKSAPLPVAFCCQAYCQLAEHTKFLIFVHLFISHCLFCYKHSVCPDYRRVYCLRV